MRHVRVPHDKVILKVHLLVCKELCNIKMVCKELCNIKMVYSGVAPPKSLAHIGLFDGYSDRDKSPYLTDMHYTN
jgi:hypothetical protein